MISRKESEIVEKWKGDVEAPLLSVCCITYNHERYIEQALDGFLMQETEFPFEIIVYDDASTDGTQEIIREYQSKFPRLIFPILQRENQYSKGVRGILARFTFPKARGKYIALCEGDDYWTDPKKLQKQVDVLERNPDFSICFHPVKFVHEGIPGLDRVSHGKFPEVTTIEELARGNYIPTASCVFRKCFDELPPWYYECPIGDYPLHMITAQYGKIRFINEVMAVYRVHEKGIWGVSERGCRMMREIEALEIMRKNLKGPPVQLDHNICYHYYKLAKIFLKSNNYAGSFFYIRRAIEIYGMKSFLNVIVYKRHKRIFSS